MDTDATCLEQDGGYSEHPRTDGAEGESDVIYSTRAEWNMKVREEKIRIVMSQTEYDRPSAESVLQELGWDCKGAIARYLRGGEDSVRPRKNPSTVNQQIYGEIRKLMDTASMEYYRKKDYEREYEKHMYEKEEKYRTSNGSHDSNGI